MRERTGRPKTGAGSRLLGLATGQVHAMGALRNNLSNVVGTRRVPSANFGTQRVPTTLQSTNLLVSAPHGGPVPLFAPYSRTSANSSSRAVRAFSPWAASTTTFSRTSLVLIMAMLMPALARHWKTR